MIPLKCPQCKDIQVAKYHIFENSYFCIKCGCVFSIKIIDIDKIIKGGEENNNHQKKT